MNHPIVLLISSTPNLFLMINWDLLNVPRRLVWCSCLLAFSSYRRSWYISTLYRSINCIHLDHIQSFFPKLLAAPRPCMVFYGPMSHMALPGPELDHFPKQGDAFDVW